MGSEMLKSFQEIINEAKKGDAKKLVVPFMEKEDMELLGKAADAGLIIPCLVGDGKAIETALRGALPASMKYEIIDEKDPNRVLQSSIRLIREGHADILMQGNIDHQAFIDAVLDAKKGLRERKLISYISVFELPKQEKLILVTDTFITNSPTIDEKKLILENALQLAGILGIDKAKVAALAAIEQINLSIPSTLDAAVLSKMSERKQFGDAVVEGPLDIDCALSRIAAARKGLLSVVPGNVDIYLVPEIDTGHLLAESLVFFGKMPTAGAIMGTVNPVIMNLPFISAENRIAQIALAAMICTKDGTDA
jgi:phosphate butyryltransferase